MTGIVSHSGSESGSAPRAGAGTVRQAFGGTARGGFDYLDFRVEVWDDSKKIMASIPVRWPMGGPDVFVHGGDTVTLVGAAPGAPFALINHTSQLLCIKPRRNWFRWLFDKIFTYLIAGGVVTFMIASLAMGGGGRHSDGVIVLISLPGLVVLFLILQTFLSVGRAIGYNSRRRHYAREAAKLVSWTESEPTGSRGVVEGVMAFTRHPTQAAVGWEAFFRVPITPQSHTTHAVDWEIFRIAIEGSEREKLVCAIQTLKVKGGLRVGDIVRLSSNEMLFKGCVNIINSVERT